MNTLNNTNIILQNTELPKVAERKIALKKEKIYMIKHEIESNNRLLGLLTFKRCISDWGRSDYSQFCDACKLGQDLVSNLEIVNENNEIKLCPKHRNIFYDTKEKAKKDNSRLEKRLAKLENGPQA